MSDGVFVSLCRRLGLAVVAEHRFHPTRRWRFDYALVDNKVALEVQGGLFVGGRHSRGPALLKEHEKLNAAAVLGWRVLFVTPKTLLSDGPDLLFAAKISSGSRGESVG